MSYEVKGRLVFIGSTAQVTETFRKKEFAIEIKEIVGDKEYTNYVKLQLTQNKTEALTGFAVGDNIKCQFNLKGSKSIKNGVTNYFTNVECWKIEPALEQPGPAYQQRAAQAAGKAYQKEVKQSDISQGNESDNLPF